MNLRTRRVLAVAFSILVVTATLTPAAAALEPASEDQSGDLLGDYDMPLSGPDNGQGNGDGNKSGGAPNQTTSTTQPPTTTTPPGNNNTTTTTTTERPGNGNGSQGPPNGSEGPPNGSEGPPNGSEGPPENPGGGTPSGVGDNGDDNRGPPEWVRNSQTPPSLDGNRSALGNNSSVFRNATINVTVTENASAVDYRLAAIDTLQDAEFDGPGQSAKRHRTEALEALDDSLPYVLDANRTTAARLFELDKEASTPPQFAPNVTKLLVRSDQQLAETSIADAESVRAILRERNVSFNETRVEENITEAKAAVARAERFRDRDRDQHHVAITQYKVAWIHAQQALDVLDLATTPNVTITTHEDMPHERNVTYTVRGRVFDVRGHELDLVLSLNGANRTVPVSVNTTPGAVGTFETNVTLSGQVNRIVVLATDPNRRWSPDYDDGNATTGRDLLRLDADGLPDSYEQNITGTDPLDPDSNSTHTASNESANNITDGAEDFDSDGATVYEAYRFDLDPLDNDTDGDRLLDGFELQFRGMDPLTVHTDNDTVADSAEDPDNDTLANLREQNASTNPVRADSDGDTLNDSGELTNGTDPLTRDTDDDGLADPDEYEVETDPTVADTDGDGVLDGNETFSTTTKNESVGAAVNISGEGNVAKTVTIQNETNEQIQTETVSNASVSEVLDFDADATFDEANLSIDYDDEKVENESALAVYTYDPKLQTYRKLPSSVDAENDSVTGTTPHFSTFVVMNESAWKAYMQSRAKPKPSVALNESFADLGGWNCTGSCSTGGGRVVVGQNSSLFYSDNASAECQGETLPDGSCPYPGEGDDDYDGGNESDDDGDDDNGGSNSDPPKSLGSANLTKSISIPEDAVEVTVTGPISAFVEEGNASVTVAVQLGSDTRRVLELQGEDGERDSKSDYIDETFKTPTGEHVRFWVKKENFSGASLPSIDVELKRDSDDDGLTNELETLGIKTGTGRVYTDPYDSDTDGDGLLDSEEILGYVPSYTDSVSGHYRIKSDPTEFDTDRDGLNDYKEAEVWNTKPRNRDSDTDGYNDLVDERPNVEDTIPDVRVHQADQDYAEIAINDNQSSVSSVVINGSYTPKIGDQFWKESTPSDCNENPNTYDFCKIHIYQHGSLSESPDKYYLNVTDTNGNKVVFQFTDSSNSSSLTVSAAAVASGARSFKTGHTVINSLVKGSRVATGLSLAAISAYYYEHQSKNLEGEKFDETKTTGAIPATEIAVEARYDPDHRLYDKHEVELPIKLPSGTVYQERVGDTVHRRGYGEEYIDTVFPGVLTGSEISDVLEHPNAIEQDGQYTIVIGDNPSEPGQIELWLLSGLVVSASYAAYDEVRDEHISINDEVIDKILNERKDWDHNQLGDSKEEVLSNLIKIIENPDEIWKDPNQNRWMYTKRIVLNGRELIVVLFVLNGEVRSAFVPTHEEYSGATGYSDEYAKWYIQDQELIKKYENDESGGIVPEVDEGEQAEKPEGKPDPTNK